MRLHLLDPPPPVRRTSFMDAPLLTPIDSAAQRTWTSPDSPNFAYGIIGWHSYYPDCIRLLLPLNSLSLTFSSTRHLGTGRGPSLLSSWGLTDFLYKKWVNLYPSPLTLQLYLCVKKSVHDRTFMSGIYFLLKMSDFLYLLHLYPGFTVILKGLPGRF